MRKRPVKGLWHVLSRIDPELKTAVCTQCGPTRISPPRPGRPVWQCLTARRRYRRRPGLRTDGEILAATIAQQGRCAACLTPETPDAPLHDDHCHATQKPRGMLCRRCNHTLGHVGDSIERLLALAEYLALYQGTE
jgi:hypothetical protein